MMRFRAVDGHQAKPFAAIKAVLEDFRAGSNRHALGKNFDKSPKANDQKRRQLQLHFKSKN